MALFIKIAASRSRIASLWVALGWLIGVQKKEISLLKNSLSYFVANSVLLLVVLNVDSIASINLVIAEAPQSLIADSS